MDEINDVTIENMMKSNFVKPFRIRYSQNQIAKVWDCIEAHDSVVILIHHIERDTFIFVKQFRPAVYISDARRANGGTLSEEVDTSKLPKGSGITYELCAGILDKEGATVEEMAKMEILEETGYDVPLENIETITTSRSGVGISGTIQTVFYARVTSAMKKTEGGGNAHEGEMIDVVEVPVKDSLEFAMDVTKPKPVGMQFILMWFHIFKSKQTTNSI